MGKVSPLSPDYAGAANAQAKSSKAATDAQTNANRATQSNPFSNSTWQQGPDGKWIQSSSFSGQMGQAAGNLQQQYADMLRQPMQDGSAARDQAIDASYKQATSRLDPQWKQREEAQRTQLMNQGLDPSSEAAQNANRDMTFARNDAYGSAMNNAIGQGQAAGDSVFRNNMAARQMPLQQLLGMQGLLGQQGYNAAQRGDPNQQLAAAGMQGNFDMQSAEQQNKQIADAFGGGMGLIGGLGGLFGLSDERAKQSIQRLPVEALPGVPFATWEYRHAPGRRWLGVIAQDLEKVAPRFVATRADGMKLVDYSFLEVARG